MVKKVLFFLSFTFSVIIFGAEFTASVVNRDVYLNESFSLNLTLKDTSAKTSPSFSTLKKHFLIDSERQSSNTSIINGKISSSIKWNLSLTPKIEGTIEIPPISINTEDGLLFTSPIIINVINSPSPQSKESSTGLKISAKVTNASPYKNEPLIYTASLSSKAPLYNIQMQKIDLKDAIVELLEQPKLEEKLVDGLLLNVVEFTYLITPLKTGPLTIPPLAIQGAIPQKGKGQFRSFFNDDLDPFGMMQGFNALKPFTLVTDEVELNVQNIVLDVSPWLPATQLTLEEKLPTDETLRVGQPFSRTFIIKAKGPKASQLPHLEDFQNQIPSFKVYADKPEEEQNIFQGIVHSIRKEQYTFVPEKAGTLTLPEISINWWDSVKKEKKVSTIPSKTLEILPSLETKASDPEQVYSNETETVTAHRKKEVFFNPMIGVLLSFLIGALIWGFTLQRKIANLTKVSSKKQIPTSSPKPQKRVSQPVKVIQKEKKEKLPDLNPT